MTVQEVSTSELECEPESKNMISGGYEYLWCVPFFGKIARQYHKNCCGLWWEFNSNFFNIQGEPPNIQTLRTWIHRFRVLHLKACFASDSTKVNIERCIIPGDCDSARFLESPHGKHVYIEMVLIPWVKQHDAAESRDICITPNQ